MSFPKAAGMNRLVARLTAQPLELVKVYG